VLSAQAGLQEWHDTCAAGLGRGAVGLQLTWTGHVLFPALVVMHASSMQD
jgi:hypothetical protein